MDATAKQAMNLNTLLPVASAPACLRWRHPSRHWSLSRASSAQLLLTRDNLRRLLLAAYTRDVLGTHARICVLAKSLRERYRDWHRYGYYHVLVGSTPPEGLRWDDLPGGEIRAFLEELAAGASDRTRAIASSR